MGYQEVEILEHKPIAKDIYSMVVACDDEVGPGQFYMLRRTDSTVLLPRAISVCDSGDGKVRFVYQTVGDGTKGFAKLNAGDTFAINGPLGNCYPIEEMKGKIAVVGGSCGIAPMLLTAKLLKKQGVQVDAIAGFAHEPFLSEDFEQVVDNLYITTESGAVGHKGLVTDVLKPREYDTVLVCGTRGMMRAVVEQCLSQDTEVYLSMEAKMACGMGACLVCACALKGGKNVRGCKDGPIFRGEEIDFDA